MQPPCSPALGAAGLGLSAASLGFLVPTLAPRLHLQSHCCVLHPSLAEPTSVPHVSFSGSLVFEEGCTKRVPPGRCVTSRGPACSMGGWKGTHTMHQG